MREERVKGSYSKIWEKLKTTISKIGIEQTRIILSFNNGYEVENLDFLVETISKNDNLYFQIEYNIELNESQSLEQKVSEFYERISKLPRPVTVSHITALICNFRCNFKADVSEKVLEILELINKKYESNSTKKEFFFFICPNVVRKISLSAANRESWLIVWNIIREKRIKHHILSSYTIEYSVHTEDEVTELRYFMPLWHDFYKNGIKLELKLSFGKSLGENKKFYRSKLFFSFLQMNIKENIFLNGTPLDKIKPTKAVADLFPLLSFDENDYPESAIKNNIIWQYLDYINNFDNYKGDLEVKINKENKKRLRDNLLEQVLVKFINEKKIEDILKSSERLESEKNFFSSNEVEKVFLNVPSRKFTILIFLFLVRNLIENKAAFIKIIEEQNEKNGKTYQLNQFVINMVWEESKSYAESLSQLIENSQRHSKGHIAYFGMRVYNASPNAPINSLPDEVNKRHMLWYKYWDTKANTKEKTNSVKFRKTNKTDIINFNHTNNIFNLRNESRGSVVFPNFIEFYILDDAIEKDNAYGILNNIVDKGILNEDRISLCKMMELKETDYTNGKTEEYYIEHYGLRWFSKHIENLFGIFQIYSPYFSSNVTLDKVFYSNIFEYENKKIDDNNSYKNLFSTEFNILVPLGYDTVPSSFKDYNSNFDKDYIENLFIPPNELRELKKCDIVISDNKDRSDPANELFNKKTEIKRYLRLFEEKIKKESSILFISIKVDNLKGSIMIEILAKALFSLIYRNESKIKLYFAINFGENKDFAREFIRIFSIFYDKIGGNSYMENVQIAVCSNSKENEVGQVHFVLAGKNMASAYKTASIFVYYDAEASLEFVPLLRFLSSKNCLDEKEVPIFPYDLYLKNGDKDEKSWFETEMLKRLNTTITSRRYGCKVPNVNVRLGSKINIDTFYDAELLFHNLGNTKRFAYLIVKEIIENGELEEGINNGRNQIFLLGYENYSALLIQEIHHLLSNAYSECSFKWVIDTKSEDFPILSFDRFSEDEIKEINIDKLICITILPLSSTMTTIYKLQNSFHRGLENKKKTSVAIEDILFLNYSILAIGDIYSESSKDAKNNENGKNDKVKERYIKEVSGKENSIWHKVVLQKEKSNSAVQSVNFLFSLNAKWIDPLEAGPSELPLLQVDKTSTLLNTYFQTPPSPEVLKYYQTGSNIDLLEPKDGNNYMNYGHIVRGSNHYQFYFDFMKLTMNNKDAIKEIVKEWGKRIEPNAYNIVISPLQNSNAPFLKIILDNAFKSNLYLLHINIHETGKEYFRTKFEYIGKVMNDILNQKDRKICFYYVDDSICTGNSLARAYKFLYTLCNQYGISAPEKFTKVFLLINRSSFETAQTYVEDPNNEWHGVINLCIPSYNTYVEKNIITCPGCKITARYDLLRKRSSTNDLCQFFARHTEKHKVRNPLEYSLWMKDRIMEDSSYFQWLFEYVHFHHEKYSKEIDELWKYIEENKEKVNYSTQGLKKDETYQKNSIDDATYEQIKKEYEESYLAFYRKFLAKKDEYKKYRETCKKGKKPAKEINEYQEKIVKEICKCRTKLNECLKNIQTLENIQTLGTKLKNTDEMYTGGESTDFSKKISSIMSIIKKHQKYLKIDSCLLKFLTEFSNENSESEPTIGRLLRKEKESKDLEKEILFEINDIIFSEYFRRLKSMDTSYRALLYNDEIIRKYREKRNFSEHEEMIKNEILKLLNDCLKEEKDEYEQMADFISLIKVISRDYLAKNYPIKKAIYGILENLFKMLLEGPSSDIFSSTFQNEDDKYKCIIDKLFKFEAIRQYRILKIVIHRLALMHSPLITDSNIIKKVINKYEEYSKDVEKYRGIDWENAFLSFPKEDGMKKTLLASIKTATMEDDNDVMCYQLLKNVKGGLNNG